MKMVIFKHASAAAVLVLLSTGVAIAADAPTASSPEGRAHMKQWCKDNPEKCHEAMQQKANAWWKKVDTDGDGTISRAEAQANAPRLAADFDKVDTNKDGKITREELEAGGKQARHARGKDWWQKVDADHDGSISRDEAAANAPRVAKDFNQLDSNGDGKITPDELKAAKKN
jgi:Ca2+-binding EF-hand superfamily protein